VAAGDVPRVHHRRDSGADERGPADTDGPVDPRGSVLPWRHGRARDLAGLADVAELAAAERERRAGLLDVDGLTRRLLLLPGADRDVRVHRLSCADRGAGGVGAEDAD